MVPSTFPLSWLWIATLAMTSTAPGMVSGQARDGGIDFPAPDTAPSTLRSDTVRSHTILHEPDRTVDDPSGLPPGTGALRGDSASRSVAVRCGAPVRCRIPEGPAAQPADFSSSGPSAGRAFLFSAVVPGSAQYLAGQWRWAAYLAAEVVAWALWADRRSEAFDLRDGYRDLAWNQARRTVSGGERVDGNFEYYETLTHWTRSGRFDAEPGEPGLQPEMDPSTFNGAVWQLARDIFLPGGTSSDTSDGEALRRALEYYEERAAGSRFLWDWTGRRESQERFSRLIEKSDDEFREATIIFGAMIGNHILSAVDAFVSARLRRATDGRVEGTARLTPEHVTGDLPSVRLAFGLRVHH